MKILHISTYNSGGAANSLYRLHKELHNQNIESKWLVLKKSKETLETYTYHDSSLKLKLITLIQKIGFRLKVSNHPLKDEKEKLRKQEERQLCQGVESYHTPTTDFNIVESPLYKWADIIHFHWVAGFLDYPSFFKENRKPVVWTLHDRAPFSGGLHYCEYAASLNSTNSPVKREFSKEALEKFRTNKKTKFQALKGVSKITIVSPSSWLKEESKNSIFQGFTHHVVPYGIPDSFSYHAKDAARSHLNLPKDKFILLFVADSIQNKRKGFKILIESIMSLDLPDLLLCSVGKDIHLSEENEEYRNLNIHHFGKVLDELLLAQVYAAADYFVIPSLEDNLPNTVLESLCCGTPVLGFDKGGIPDMITNAENGYLTSTVSSKGMNSLLSLGFENRNLFDRKSISTKARAKYSLKNQALTIADIYEKSLR